MEPPRRSLLGWFLSLLLGAVGGALLAALAMRVLAPTAFLVDNEPTCPGGAAGGGARVAELDGSQILAGVAASNGSDAASASAGGKFVPGQKAEWGGVEALLKRGEDLRGQLAVSRRRFLWSTKVKMSQLKGMLRRLKALQDLQTLTFFFDDRGVGEGPKELNELRTRERNEALATWQEVDQDTRPEPLPVVVSSLKGAIERAQKSPAWSAVAQCTDGLRRVAELSGRVRRLAQARLDAEAQAALAAVGKQRMQELWNGPGEWLDAWRQPVANNIVSYTEDPGQRKRRSEIAYWVYTFNLFYPLDGTGWYPLHGYNETETGGLTKEALGTKFDSIKADWSMRAASLGQRRDSAQLELDNVSARAMEACGLAKDKMDSLVTSAEGPSGLGVCSSPEVKSDLSGTEAPGVVPLAQSWVWKREWVPEPRAEIQDSLEGVSSSTADLHPPVNVSVLLLVQWNHNLGDVFQKLASCTDGLRGTGESGRAEHMTMEVLIAVDSNLASPFRATVQQVVGDWSKPWFVTRFVAVSNGGGGMSGARAYNILAQLARGEVLLLYDPGNTWPWSNSCKFLPRMVKPFNYWPRLSAVGGQQGHMALTNTPGADYLNLERSAGEPTHNRLKDPVLKARMQFLLAAARFPLAFRRSVLLSVGGFSEDFGGSSNQLKEYDLCRRLWLAGYQVALAYVGNPDRIGPSTRRRLEMEFWRSSSFGALQDYAHFGDEAEGRIVAEVKRMNRYLKPVPIWE